MHDARPIAEPAPNLQTVPSLATPLPNGRLGQFWEGARAPWRGWRLMNERPALWRFAIVPIALNLLFTLLALALLAAFGMWFLSQWHPWFHTGWNFWFAWVGWVLEALAVLLLIVFALATTLVVWMLLSGVLCGYFYGRLAEEIEVLLGAPRESLQSIGLVAETVDTAKSVGELIVFNAGFLLLGLVPLIGPPAAMVGSTYWNWAIFGHEYLAFPLSLRGMRRADRKKFCRRHRPYNLGLGAIVMLLQFIPILGAVPLATAAAGAVILHRRIVR